MRDAFGGAFLLKLFLVFIFIYIGFTAVALNYAKAFKVKNKVIEYLENSEITDLDNMNAEELEGMESFFEKEILGNMNYKISTDNFCQGIDTEDYQGNTIAICHDSGIIIKKSGSGENTECVYYTVSTYIGWRLPFLNNLLAFNSNNQEQDVLAGLWEISGETRLIVNE